MVELSLANLPLDECHSTLLDDKSTLVQVMTWCRRATCHYLSQCRPRSISPYGVTRPQWVKINYFHSKCFWKLHLTDGYWCGCVEWVNSLALSDAIILWLHRTSSTLVHVMACYYTVKQWWLIIDKILWHLSGDCITGNIQDINLWNVFENYILKITFTSPRGEWVNDIFESMCMLFDVIIPVQFVIQMHAGYVNGRKCIHVSAMCLRFCMMIYVLCDVYIGMFKGWFRLPVASFTKEVDPRLA